MCLISRFAHSPSHLSRFLAAVRRQCWRFATPQSTAFSTNCRVSHTASSSSSSFLPHRAFTNEPLDELFDFFIQDQEAKPVVPTYYPTASTRLLDTMEPPFQVHIPLPRNVKSSFEHALSRHPPPSPSDDVSQQILSAGAPTTLGVHPPPKHPEKFFVTLRESLAHSEQEATDLIVYRHRLLTCQSSFQLHQTFHAHFVPRLSKHPTSSASASSNVSSYFPLSRALRDSMLVARLNFLDPLLAHSFFSHVKHASVYAYVQACTTQVYNQALLALWQTSQDPFSFLRLLAEMEANALPFDSETLQVFLAIHQQISTWPAHALPSTSAQHLQKLQKFLHTELIL
ncbi:translation protein [Schizosaccharomyces cryophilus OY26]|uniref:Translation protein n=1 Tax=Schizosaccharomyces cryophilus (strain OY26 / ATCC MYA-4695 / CBS 11777 / NBRC 106824 / NRRL Y48691) TaxID=653667 RepID=S9VXP0_SCHCR|nr:translation protein [Schizosaccharomyces cryophilus OY26]EPY50979.1 translation protein [Schizosaccharomyces cryophilus OY26]